MLHTCKIFYRFIFKALKMDGDKLQAVLKRHGVTGKQLAAVNKMNIRGIYRYFGMADIKRKTVVKLLTSVGIDITEYDNFLLGEGATAANTLNEPGAVYGSGKNKYHHGRNLQMLLQQRGVNITAFSTRMNISRQTMYRFFDEQELPPGFLLQAAAELNVSPSLLKGFGEGAKGFEKDIYQMLYSMGDRLAAIENKLANQQ